MTAESQADGHDPETIRAPIHTRRLFLRAPTVGDIPALARVLADRRIASNTSRIPYPYPPIEGWRFMRASAVARDGEIAAIFIVTRRGNPRRLAGAAGFDWKEGDDPEIGYWIAAGERRHGFALEVSRALLARLFADAEIQRVQAWCRVENRASLGVLRRLGFRRIGNGHRFSRMLCRYVPVIQLALSRRDWARRAKLRPAMPG